MGTTNQPTPVILDDEALAGIEARRPRTVHYNCPFVPLSETERDALCQTVRALEAALRKADEVFNESCDRNIALHEQLARVENERDEARQHFTRQTEQLAQVEKERDEMRTQLRAAIPYVNGKRRQLRLLRHVGPYAEGQP